MMLLSLSLANHDISFSYYDGNVVKYAKLERILQRKHFGSVNFWFVRDQLKKHFEIDIQDVDDVSVDFDSRFWSIHNYSSNNLINVIHNDLTHFELDDDFKYRFGLPNKRMWFLSHHYAHSLSGWMLCDNPDVSFVIDGSGDNRSWSVYSNDKLIDKEKNFKINNKSIGNSMSEIGSIFGIKCPPNDALDNAGKIMGLQSYGNLDHEFLNHLRQYGMEDIKNIFDINQWVKYKKDSTLATFSAADWIRTVHERVGELLVSFFGRYAKKNDKIFFSGGVAQNVVWNTKLRKEFPNLIIPPHSLDEGLSLGGIEFLRRKHNLPKFELPNFPYSQSDVAPNSEPSDETIKKVAKLLSEGKVVGWYQGNGEIGPRALGNRSILMDPRLPKERINEIKKRENYRPFGASVLKEYANQYFDMEWYDDYMLYTCNVLVKGLDAITHVDGSCRVQTVSDNNPSFRKLLEEFNEITNLPILLNTSMNLSGKPIAAYPEIARQFLYVTNIDYVVIGNEMYHLDQTKTGVQ